MKSGRWFTHDLGARKIATCSQEFYKACINRLNIENKEDIQYQAWMSSPYFASSINDVPIDVHRNRDKEILSFSRADLEETDWFLQKIVSESLSESFSASKVFVNVQKSRRSMAIFQESFKMVGFWSDWMRIVFSSVVNKVVPICGRNGNEIGVSFTDPNLIGSIFASVNPNSPFPSLRLNIDFAHELAHQALMIYQHAGDLLLGTDAWVYSGVRKVERPAISSFHASAALVYMIYCVQSLLLHVEAIDERAYLQALLLDFRESLHKGLEAVANLPKSDLGEQIYRDMYLALL